MVHLSICAFQVGEEKNISLSVVLKMDSRNHNFGSQYFFLYFKRLLSHLDVFDFTQVFIWMKTFTVIR